MSLKCSPEAMCMDSTPLSACAEGCTKYREDTVLSSTERGLIQPN